MFGAMKIVLVHAGKSALHGIWGTSLHLYEHFGNVERRTSLEASRNFSALQNPLQNKNHLLNVKTSMEYDTDMWIRTRISSVKWDVGAGGLFSSKY